MLFLLLLPKELYTVLEQMRLFLNFPSWTLHIAFPFLTQMNEFFFSLLTIRDLWKGIGRWRENILRRCLVLIGELVTFRCPNAPCIPLLNLGATYLVIYWRPHGWHVFQGSWRQKNKQVLWKVHWGGALPTPSPEPAWLIASGEAVWVSFWHVQLHSIGTRERCYVNSAGTCAQHSFGEGSSRMSYLWTWVVFISFVY